jgi:hypothetical protein
MSVRVLLIGNGELSERQRQMLSKHFGNYILVSHIPIIHDEDLRKIKLVESCEDLEEEICVDVAVFLKILTKPAVELLKKGVRVFDFEVVPSPDWKGDLHGGLGKTIGLREYKLKPKAVMRWVYAE